MDCSTEPTSLGTSRHVCGHGRSEQRRYEVSRREAPCLGIITRTARSSPASPLKELVIELVHRIRGR
jgi:hypothetical protein